MTRCIGYLSNGTRCDSEAARDLLCDHCRARMMGRHLGRRRKTPPAYCDRCGHKLRRRSGKLTCFACIKEEERRIQERARLDAWLAKERELHTHVRGRQPKPCAVCPLCAGMSWAVQGKECRACGRHFAPEPLKPVELYATERKYVTIG